MVRKRAVGPDTAMTSAYSLWMVDSLIWEKLGSMQTPFPSNFSTYNSRLALFWHLWLFVIQHDGSWLTHRLRSHPIPCNSINPRRRMPPLGFAGALGQLELIAAVTPWKLPYDSKNVSTHRHTKNGSWVAFGRAPSLFRASTSADFSTHTKRSAFASSPLHIL